MAKLPRNAAATPCLRSQILGPDHGGSENGPVMACPSPTWDRVGRVKVSECDSPSFAPPRGRETGVPVVIADMAFDHPTGRPLRGPGDPPLSPGARDRRRFPDILACPVRFGWGNQCDSNWIVVPCTPRWLSPSRGAWTLVPASAAPAAPNRHCPPPDVWISRGVSALKPNVSEPGTPC